MKTAYIYEDSLKLRKTWFRRPCPARAYTTIVVPVFTLTTSLELFDLFMLFKLFRLSYLNHFTQTTSFELHGVKYFTQATSIEICHLNYLQHPTWTTLCELCFIYYTWTCFLWTISLELIKVFLNVWDWSWAESRVGSKPQCVAPVPATPPSLLWLRYRQPVSSLWNKEGWKKAEISY